MSCSFLAENRDASNYRLSKLWDRLEPPRLDCDGKRLKCPKCAHRFVITETDARSASTAPGLADAAQTSLYEVPSNLPPLPDNFPAPRAEGHLRETFDLPSLGEQEEPGLVPDLVPDKAIGDANSLFDHSTAPKRRRTSAEARSQARRCTSCQGFVPAGMSICQVCGLDQETGVRVDLEEDLGPKSPPPMPGPPLHVAIVGGICGIGGIILVLIAVVVSLKQDSDALKYGWLCLALISGFGAYASYEFVRGRSVRLLLLALTLGVFVDVAGMIALPVIHAQFIEETTHATAPRPKGAEASAIEEPDEEDFVIRPTVDLINLDQIKLGLTFVGIYVALSVYLMSPPVKRYINRRHLDLSPIPLG